jgi:hypothetical protein
MIWEENDHPNRHEYITGYTDSGRSAFRDLSSLVGQLNSAWETEVWIEANPAHMSHFNSEAKEKQRPLKLCYKYDRKEAHSYSPQSGLFPLKNVLLI